MISVRSLQRSEGNVSDPMKYICIFLIIVTRRVDLAMSVWPSVRLYVRPFLRKLVSQFLSYRAKTLVYKSELA